MSFRICNPKIVIIRILNPYIILQRITNPLRQMDVILSQTSSLPRRCPLLFLQNKYLRAMLLFQQRKQFFRVLTIIPKSSYDKTL